MVGEEVQHSLSAHGYSSHNPEDGRDNHRYDPLPSQNPCTRAEFTEEDGAFLVTHEGDIVLPRDEYTCAQLQAKPGCWQFS